MTSALAHGGSNPTRAPSRRELLKGGVGTAHGTFGELLQGALPGDSGDAARFLVTLPVARWSLAHFDTHGTGDGVDVSPEHKTKSARLAESLLSDLGLRPSGRLTLRGSLPEGKGMASSSADLVATARAVLAAVGATISPDRLGTLMAAIEPTDGVQYPGVVAYHHRTGRLRHRLGHLPPLQVVALDEGGMVDTVSFNRRETDFPFDVRQEYAHLLGVLTDAMRHRDLHAVGQVATRSAQLNQRLMPHRHLEALERISRSVGGLGVVACHSGTMVGVLLDQQDAGYRRSLRRTVEMCRELGERLQLVRTAAE